MPDVYVIGGPNGAGKTTSAFELLPGLLACDEYVNADAIAAGLSPFRPDAAALEAGRLMVARIHTLARRHASFAFETTLASRSFAPHLRGMQADGFTVHLVYLWLRSPELAAARVAERVALGGHNVPRDVIVRRYWSGARNFRDLYLPIADEWVCYDNSACPPASLVARGQRGLPHDVSDGLTWAALVESGR